MATGHPHAKALIPAIGFAVLACLFACPASTGDNVRIVPLYSDQGGNGAWVEVDSAGERTTAKPFVAVGREDLGKVLDNPEEKGSLAVPVPRLMRLVERVRKAIRDMKQPAATNPAGPGVVTSASAGPAGQVCKSRGAPPDGSNLSPPEKTDAGILPPDLQYSTAAR